MIRYAVRCDHGHQWEAWFASSSAYDDQAARGLVECPYCASTTVEKAPMAPAVAGTRKSALSNASDTPRLSLSGPPDPVAMPGALRELLHQWREHVRKTHDNVGDTFAREARAMHEGDTEPRPIYGTATASEARALVEDGVPVLPLPGVAPELAGPDTDKPERLN